MSTAELAYYVLPDREAYPGALGRYLAPLPTNVVEAYVNAYTASGDLVLDPFAHTESLARVTARLGRRAILSDLNPLTSFVARAGLLPVTAQELRQAFNRLAAVKQAQTPLAEHFDGLYATICPSCGAPAVAVDLIWDRKADVLIGKRCVCKQCHLGEEDEAPLAPITQEDAARAREIEPRGFHYWYVADRIGQAGEAYREVVGQLLDLYTPRNAYALATLVRHIEGSGEGPNVQQVLKLAVLDCLCACSKLEGVDTQVQASADIDLRPPARFLERNVWRWFSAACRSLAQRIESRGAEPSPARLTATMGRLLDANAYGRLGKPPNAMVLRQAARHLHKELPPGAASLLITVPPGPAHGTLLCLSYLWSGWLLGPDEAQVLEQIPCSRRPMDWAAYFRAVASAVRGLLPTLKDGAPAVFLFTAEHVRQCDMLVLGSLAGGLRLQRVLCQPLNQGGLADADSQAEYSLEFRKVRGSEAGVARFETGAGAGLDLAVRREIDHAVRDLLALRAEPTSYLWLHMAVLQHLGQKGLLLAWLAAQDFDAVAVSDRLRKETADALESGVRRKRLVKPEARGDWWALARTADDNAALSDRVEWAVYNLLATARWTNKENALLVVHGLFPGLLVPERGWIEECLASYGVQARDGLWTLGEANRLASRLEEHSRALAALAALGRRFGYNVWLARNEQKRPFADATLGHLLTVAERYASPATQLGGPQAADVDAVWYDGGSAVWLFEVEWTAMLTAAVCSRRLPVRARRYLIVTDERVPLIVSKLRRSPWLQRQLEADGWEFIKYSHLLAFAESEEATQYNIGSIVGLQPAIESAHGQMSLI